MKILRLAPVLSLLLCTTILSAQNQTPPNFILILADDLGWADLGCYGNTFNESPHLDRLASEGIRFTQFYAGPVCSPTRANLQSGQDQARFGITQHIPGHRRPFAKLIDPVVPHQLPLSVETFAERLAKAGYTTGYFGKWHLGKEGFGPAEQGWHTAVELHGNAQSSKATGASKARRTTEVIADKAEQFIAEHKEKPFLLQLSHCAVHIPLTTNEAWLSHFQRKQPAPDYPSRPDYAGLLAELDESVGRVVAAVDRAGLAERTVILFISDNGGLEHEQNGQVVTSNQPLRGEKGTLYEGGIRVPAIARWTGRISPGTICETPASTLDIYPTLVELAGTDLPTGQPVDGISLASVLLEPSQPISRNAMYWHLPHYHHSTPASAIRVGDWKLIEFFETNEVQLFNLRADLSESQNLAAIEVERAQAMRSSLQAWRKEIGAQMPTANPHYDPERASELGQGKGK